MSSTYTDIIDDAMRKWNRVIKYTPYKIHVTVDLKTFSNANKQESGEYTGQGDYDPKAVRDEIYYTINIHSFI